MADLLRISLMGTLPSGEEWSVNPVFKIGGDFGAPVSATQAATIATAVSAVTVPAGVRLMQNSTTAHTGCRVEARSFDGTLESIAEAIRGTPVGGSGGQSHPFQTSLVTSLRTASAGASGRGRLYWPATGIQIEDSTLRPSSVDMAGYLAGVKTYLSGIQTAVDATLDGVTLAVWSRKLESTFTVTSLQMGNVPDTQRRRRDTLVEGYSTVAYP